MSELRSTKKVCSVLFANFDFWCSDCSEVTNRNTPNKRTESQNSEQWTSYLRTFLFSPINTASPVNRTKNLPTITNQTRSRRKNLITTISRTRNQIESHQIITNQIRNRTKNQLTIIINQKNQQRNQIKRLGPK